MSAFEQRDFDHFTKLAALAADLRGGIRATLEMLDAGQITPEQALAKIRQRHAEHEGLHKAAWDSYTGGAR